MKEIREALYSELAGDSSLIAELDGATAIYYSVAPQGTPRPYVVFFNAGGGPENIFPGDLTSERYVIKAVADSLDKALDIDADIKGAIHKQTLTVTGVTNIWTRREDEVSMAEVGDDGKLIYHEGGFYRIRVDA